MHTSILGGSAVLACAGIIATAAVFGLTYSLSAALIALDLAERGLSESLIGANAAMHAVGVLVMAFLLPRIGARWGLRRSITGALALAALLLCLFPMMPLVWLWFPLRVVLGAASEVLFVLSETWLNALTSEGSRARTMGAYTAALSIGFALGPVILSLVGSDGFTAYGVGAALVAAAALFVALARIAAPDFEKPEHGNPVRYMRLAPVAMGATALNAAIETAGLTFLTLYAMSLGWGEAEATQLMACMMFGAIVLQVPIGWLGDRMDRERLIVALAVVSALGAAIWPFVLASPVMTYALLFVWGGVFVGIYTITIAILGDRYHDSELVSVYALLSIAWGVGALLGPLVGGLAMEISPHGLPVFAAIACGLFAIFASLDRPVARTVSR